MNSLRKGFLYRYSRCYEGRTAIEKFTDEFNKGTGSDTEFPLTKANVKKFSELLCKERMETVKKVNGKFKIECPSEEGFLILTFWYLFNLHNHIREECLKLKKLEYLYFQKTIENCNVERAIDILIMEFERLPISAENIQLQCYPYLIGKSRFRAYKKPCKAYADRPLNPKEGKVLKLKK